MKFFEKKKFLPIFMATIVVAGTTYLVYATKNHQSISENEVRSQLEQMYSAEVADLTIGQDQDVYEALITKSGAMYVVEMNAVTGDVLSLTQADEYIVKETMKTANESVKEILEQPKIISENTDSKSEEKVDLRQPKKESNDVEKQKNAVVSQKRENNSKTTDETKTTKPVEKPSGKIADTTPVKAEEKALEQKEEKSIKDVIKEVLKTDSSKTESEKTDQVKVETSKTEITKSSVEKTEEVSKTDGQSMADGQKAAISLASSQPEVAKTEAETKSASTATVLILEDQAIKIAQQQYKGTKESSSFVKTDEGGYYLILIKATASEGEAKESSKGKATIQVHAISGKILSVTLE